MACRSVQRAEVARQKLLLILDKHIEKLRNGSHYDGHAESFRRNVKVVIHSIDLASLDTIPKFVQQLQSKCVLSIVFWFLLSDTYPAILMSRISYAMQE